MTKGFRGQSCSEAIKSCFSETEGLLSFSQIMASVKEQGSWKDTTIWRHLMSTVVNLIPARYEWTNDKFLFLRPDGRYEIFIPEKHPEPIE
jgi:hypothetical protein